MCIKLKYIDFKLTNIYTILHPSFLFIISVQTLNMTHQTTKTFDSVTTQVTQDDIFHKDSDLLVKSKLKNLSKLTSNPKRVFEILESYMGAHNYHQME